MKKQQPKRESTVLKGFGAVEPHNRPEDWAQVREEVETLIAEDVVTRGQQTAPKEESP